MNTVRMLKTREVVVKKEVIDTFEWPVIDFVRGVTAEVTDNSHGAVFLDGIMLKGVKLNNFHTRRSGFRLDPICVVLNLSTPVGDVFTLTVNSLKVTDGHIPSTAKLVETVDQAP